MVHTYSDKNNPGTGLTGDILVSFEGCIVTRVLIIEEFFCKSRIYQRELSLYTVGRAVLFIL